MMSRVVTTLFIVLSVFAINASAQDVWNFNSVFPSDTLHPGNMHGIAVDPDGNIWVQNFSAYASDTIFVPVRNAQTAVRALYVHRPDGSQLDFSPIFFVTVNGVQDTLGGFTNASNAWEANTGRGLRMAADGNIIATYFHNYYLIDYKTGEGIAKAIPSPGNSGVAGGVATDNGNIFTANVVPGSPIVEYDKDLNLLGNAIDSSRGFSRAFEVSPDGNTIYWAGYTNNAIYKYTRPDEFSAFNAVPDTILKGFASESFAWQPGTGYLWLSAGSGLNPPNGFAGAATNYTPHTWYGYDPATDTIVDSLTWNNIQNSADQRPRGIAFSPSGDSAYVVNFASNSFEGIQVFVKSPGTGIGDGEWTYVRTFHLQQNYPNPFNPQTTIPFELEQQGHVKVTVFDNLGRVVSILADEEMSPGSHKVTFDAKGLPTGAYHYRLEFNGQVLTKKMLFVK